MRKKAVFTTTKDENSFSDVWLNYYSKHFNKKDIYFLDFGSSAEYLKLHKENCSIINSPIKIIHWYDQQSEVFSEVKRIHGELLKSYEYVLFCDCDEIIHHPTGLGNYIDETQHEYTTCTGYEIIHLPDREPNLDLSKSILSQRNYWYREYFHFSKTSLSSKPLKWGIGYHNTEEPKRFEENFILLHLHKWDYNFCLNRHMNWGNTGWSQKSIKEDNCWHYQIKTKEKFDEWYYSGLNKSQLELIPEKIKKEDFV